MSVQQKSFKKQFHVFPTDNIASMETTIFYMETVVEMPGSTCTWYGTWPKS